MSNSDHNKPLEVGDFVPDSLLYGDPPNSSDPALNLFFGLKESDEMHRLYALPTNTPIGQIVREFQVGSHGAASYSMNKEETIQLVAAKAEAIAALVPCRVTFADAAGLKLQFLRQVTEADLKKIEALFPPEQMMQAGLERYISELEDENQSILAPVMQENLFHFWWD